MTRKYGLIIAAGSSLGLLVAAGLVGSASKNGRSQEITVPEKRGTFKQQLAGAKSRGEKKLQMSGLVVTYEHVKSLDEVLSRYDLVVASPVEQRGYLNKDDGVESWYRFKILDTISRAASPPTLPFDPPAEFSPVADDEVLIPKSGGTVQVEGVEVTLEEHGFPAFSLSEKYLLFLKTDRVKKVASADLGPSGALIISDDGSLKPVGGSPSLKGEVEKRYGKSIKEITKRKSEVNGLP
jgi:hypothetical protein